MRLSIVLATSLAVSAASGCGSTLQVADLIAHGHVRELRKRAKDAPRTSAGHPSLLFLAFDGVSRSLIYDLLRNGELPHLASLLGGEQDGFSHAYFDDTLLATMPSSTMAAWTTAMTGLPPGEHGITGNEFFIREERRLGAPAPVSFSSAEPTLAMYTKGYLDRMKQVPSVYDRLREKERDLLVWVAVHQIFSGADRLLVTKPTILVTAFAHVVETAARKLARKEKPRQPYVRLDNQVIDVVVDELKRGPVPDVLTVYLSGTDLYAHIAREGPDDARRSYLKEVVDPAMGRLEARLRERDALADRWVVLTSDHGHSQVLHDDEHALATKIDDDAPAVMTRAGYKLRPMRLDVSKDDPFDAVFCGGGATAYVYVADRSTCGAQCDWTQPPRYEADVLPAADAYFRASMEGTTVPGMKGTIDLVLTRRPRAYAEVDLPFEVYIGGGETQPVAEYLAEHPHPTYIDAPERLRELAEGHRGERAGDVMLVAHNGDREDPAARYYFAALYRSWHGSPSRQDSEIPLVVAHPRASRELIRGRVSAVLGERPRQQKITDLLIDLRQGAAP